MADFDGNDILEVGCGDGRLTWRYAREAASVLAIDPDTMAVAKAEELLPAELKAIVTFQTANMVTLDLRPSAYDIALFAWSM